MLGVNVQFRAKGEQKQEREIAYIRVIYIQKRLTQIKIKNVWGT